MSTGAIAITGWGVLSSAGIGADEFARAVTAGRGSAADVSEMFEEPVPRQDAFALVDFKVRDYLGRKGTSFLDRSTSLAMVACGQALADTDLVVDDSNNERVGIALGTTAGSVKSTSDYSRDTFVQERPYLVNPLVFPNAVMNCAAGQSAIRYRLRGVNTTVAGGALAALSALRYARNLIGCGYADALLVGTTEEFSPQVAWATHFAMEAGGGDLAAGEGAAVFVVEDADAVREAGRRPDAEVLAIEVGLHVPADEATAGPETDFSESLAGCVVRALSRAGVEPGEVWAVASAENGMPLTDGFEDRAIRAVLGDGPVRLRVKEFTGESHSASGAFQVAALLARHRADPTLDGRVSVVTTRTSDGAIGAAVLRGWSRGVE
ncbi:beta-ketoacyl synthase [Solihabitans fulvus]|uniref:Beta-ketoacyl synthase n=1 Tax=Solihabitans fulvus TaxID=1892852 RepID=A0A5B2WUA1_9PSEU|nr:beta-ketoacyl synthase N-terminal-like domain-containing protein [Solihabitans fulvus]KAA2254450.1 beta-ketoacyl synthase [Solihabitans fulvus]